MPGHTNQTDCNDDRCHIHLDGYVKCDKHDHCDYKAQALKLPCTTTADQLVAAVNGLAVNNIPLGPPVNLGNDGWVLLYKKPA